MACGLGRVWRVAGPSVAGAECGGGRLRRVAWAECGGGRVWRVAGAGCDVWRGPSVAGADDRERPVRASPNVQQQAGRSSLCSKQDP